ncbi:MAG TPA: hypothetical protein VFV75_01315 [Candidatus Polarisedimenticolaceae bacterium]|nr:hypothetical protein [Candidatus Polarisedimenticolaceae bacterium]
MRLRPVGITALALFFALGTAISTLAAASLLVPGCALEPMWRLNPRARTAFAGMGVLAPLLLVPVSVACALAAVGLWRRRPWGYWTALGLLAVHGIADVLNGFLGTEPRAMVGIPIVLALLVYLRRPAVRGAFQVR